MCRWLAYSGSPIALDTFLLEPEHSLIDQSLHTRMGVTTTNGDGFGVGWYGDGRESALYCSITSAWNEIPEASCGVVQAGQDNLRPFRPGLLKGDRL